MNCSSDTYRSEFLAVIPPKSSLAVSSPTSSLAATSPISSLAVSSPPSSLAVSSSSSSLAATSPTSLAATSPTSTLVVTSSRTSLAVNSPTSLAELGCAHGCIDSAKTVKRVERCPQTQEAWEEEAARKNCGDIPNSCSSFVYHCVMNTWQNETLEVCAEHRFVVGKNCPEYNFLGTRIQRNEKVNCSKCPAVYNSTKSYHYLECYRHVRLADPLFEPEFTTSSTPDDDKTTQRNDSMTSSVAKGESIIQNQHSNIDMKITIALGSFCAYALLILIIAVVALILILHNDKKHP
uniref:Uncharacterized protein LOC111099596 isoform X2 n=1 Tax=Crassostrea virginica TaxID=6565 RepID=A0A8B8A7M8_CRAVI|nr:uncharacterized protein LOC111099596 isoform X2 [Crassostrea virginica]